jgi:hypothetical protein
MPKECDPKQMGNEKFVSGWFNASCNKNGDENDYCRFVESKGYNRGEKWLSCVSPDNDPVCQEFPLPESRFSWKTENLTKAILKKGGDFSSQKDALKRYFANECQFGEKCPSSANLPGEADPNSPGSAGYDNLPRGFFNATCNKNDPPEENDYCRFVGDEKMSDGIWLSCISPRSKLGCNNTFPRPSEDTGWSLSDIYVDNPTVAGAEADVGGNKLRKFFKDTCDQKPCVGQLVQDGGCSSLNGDDSSTFSTEDLSALCGNSIEGDINGYKQCIFSSEEGEEKCIASDKCSQKKPL